MKHVSALIIKFLMVAVILEILLSLLTDLYFADILVISIVVTLVSYLIGDLLILSMTNNTVSTIADAALALIVLLVFNYIYTYATIEFVDALICAAVICIGEWFFHKYVWDKVFPDRRERTS